MHVGYSAHGTGSHYWLLLNHGAEARAAELGIRLTTAHAATLDAQITAIASLIRQQVDVLVVGPTAATGLGPVLTQAQAAGIPVVVVAAPLVDAPVTCTVVADHYGGAAMAATYVAEQLGGMGDVAHLMGPSILQDNVDRAAGVRDVFAQHPGIRIVMEQESPDWSGTSGRTFMEQVLAHAPTVRGVCVANDTLALGVAAAVAAAGRSGEILVTGFDGTPDALMAIHAGQLSATIRQATVDIGRMGITVAQQIARGETLSSELLQEVRLITQENLLAETLQTTQLFPPMLRAMFQQGQALVAAQAEIIAAQHAALRELSTPIIPISDTTLVMPLIGTIDTGRAQLVIETLLQGVARRGIRTVLIDITGVLLVDTQVANVLIQAAQAVTLLGAQVVLSGIRPEVAQTLVDLGVDLRGIVTQATLQHAIAYTLREPTRRT